MDIDHIWYVGWCSAIDRTESVHPSGAFPKKMAGGALIFISAIAGSERSECHFEDSTKVTLDSFTQYSHNQVYTNQKTTLNGKIDMYRLFYLKKIKHLHTQYSGER